MRASLWRWSKDEFEDGVSHGWQRRLRRRAADSFFPPRCCETAMLEEGVSNHRHERMAVQALPGSALEVIEAEFLFQLLVSLLANPSRLDGRRQGAQSGLRRQIGEIVFLLPRHPMLADEPSLLARQMLLTLVPDPLRWSVGDAHADSSETSLSFPFVPMRQQMFRHGASASMSSAAIDRTSGTARRRGRPRPATGQIICTSGG